MADTTPTTTVASVETTAKADVAKATSLIQTDIAKLKSDLAALEAKTFSFHSVALYVGIAFVVGVLTRFL